MKTTTLRLNLLKLTLGLASAILTAAICCVMPALAEESAAPSPEAASEVSPALSEMPVVTVNGRVITFADMDAHAATIQSPHDVALEDMIAIQLLTTAATARNIKLPPLPWSQKTRTELEIAVAQALGIEAAKPHTVLIVDHAWLKDAENEKERATGRALIDSMRTLVTGGMNIPQAFAKMNLDGNIWHIGDHEEYSYEVIPPEARDLAAGSISPVIPGDGGLHLFRIYESKQQVGDLDTIVAILRSQLREGAEIKWP